MLRNQTAIREQSSNEQLYRLDIECVRFANSPRVWIVFVASKQGLFQLLSSAPCDTFGVASCYKAHIVNVLAQWLFACKTPSANSAFMDVVELWKAKVSTYSSDVLVRNQWNGHVAEN